MAAHLGAKLSSGYESARRQASAAPQEPDSITTWLGFLQRARKGMHFASLGRAFQADGRGFSPIEGGLEGGGSVS